MRAAPGISSTLPPTLPNRYISGLAIDPADPTGRTVYVGFNGFSRVWIEGPGAGLGHLWKTTDAGATWTDVSGNLPDVPVNDVLIVGGKLVVATDLGVVVSATAARPGRGWARTCRTPRRSTCTSVRTASLRRNPRTRHLVDPQAVGTRAAIPIG